MKRLARQAGRVISRLFQQAGTAIITLLVFAMLAVGALAYRLSLGPLEIPWAATWLANAVSGRDVEIHIGQAGLAWAGYKAGGHAPLFMQLGDIAIHDTSGRLLATVPQAHLAFSLSALFAKQMPIFVSSRSALIIGSTAPVSLLAGIRLQRGFTLQSADLWVTMGPGQIGPNGLDEPLSGAKFLLSVTPTDVRLSDATLTLTPFGHSAPVVHVEAAAHRSGAWHGAITLSAASVEAADLYRYWPTKLVPMTRGWVTHNITGGTARDASFRLTLSAPLHLATLSVDSATGGFKAENATLIWLQGVLPLTGLFGEFTLTDADDIDITADKARLGGIAIAQATMHIAGVSRRDQLASLNIPVSGTMQNAFAVLNGPNLRLLKTVPASVASATGDMTGGVKVLLPLQKVVSVADVKMRVETVLSNVTLPLPVQGLILRQGRMKVNATLENLSIGGTAQLAGQPASLRAKANFGANSGAPVSFDMSTIATPATLRDVGWDPGSFIQGSMPVHVHVATSAANGGRVTVNADLSQTTMALPVFGWNKQAGKPGNFSFAASLSGDQLAGIDRIDSIHAQAPGLKVETTMSGRAIDLSDVRIGDTQGAGRIVPPLSNRQPWDITLSGNALDLSAVVNPTHKAAAHAATALEQAKPAPRQPSGFLWNAKLHFDRLILAKNPEPALAGFDFSGSGQGSYLFQAQAAASVADGQPVTLTVTPQPGSAPGDAETLQLQTGDGGQLLRATGAFDDLSGGALRLSARYGVGAPVIGVTRITNFRLLNAPAMGKFLQAVTVLGIPEAASGPGLLFNRLIAPFSIEEQMLTLKDARAYSASLGFTASGTVDLNAGFYDIEGTVVPAYALNALPGKIPLLGKLFSPEKGGGLFAVRYSMKGPTASPQFKINPLSALTPGFLRGIFGLAKAK